MAIVMLERKYACGLCRLELRPRWRPGNIGEEELVMDVVAQALGFHGQRCSGTVSANPAIRVEPRLVRSS